MYRQRILFYLALPIALLLVSCSGGSPAVDVSQYEALLAAPSDPLHLELQPAGEQEARAVFAESGGTLTATGPEGTKYTLEIPEGALYAPAEVTMTPLADVGGLPFGQGATFAVDLQPSGLRLMDVAVLTIEPAQEIPIEAQVFFTAQGEGNEFYLTPPMVDSAAIQLPITHFSGYGVSKGFAAEIEPVRQRLGGDVEARLNQILAQELARRRQRAQSGEGGDSEADDQAFSNWFIKTWYTEVLKPRLDAAKESCAAGQLAIQTLLGMERQLAILGVGGGVSGSLRSAGMGAAASEVDNLSDLVKTVGEVCLKEEYELCRDDHIIHRIVPIVLSIERQGQILGSGDPAVREALVEKGKEYAERCLRFRLDFESDLQGTFMGSFNYDTERSATIDLTFNWDKVMAGNAITGKAELTSDSFDISMPPCATMNSDGGETTVEVTALQWDVSFRGADDKIGYVSDLALDFMPGVSNETFRFNCQNQYVDSMPEPAIWSGAFGMSWAQACSPASDSGGQAPPAPSDPGEIPPEILALIPPSLLPGQSASGPSAPPSAPSVGGLISPPTGGICSAGRGWQVSGGSDFASKEWDRSTTWTQDEGSFELEHTPG